MSTEIKLWKDKEQSIIDPLLFSVVAEQWAQKIGTEDKFKNKQSQLRRFFDEIVMLNDRAKQGSTDISIILPNLHMIIAKAAYAQGRKLVTDQFVFFLKGLILQVEDKKDLKVMTNFFESFIAFYKVHGPK